MNAVAYFEIQASNPETAIAFYHKVFGWKFFKEELLPIEYYQIQTEGINGGLLKRPAKTPPPEYGTNAFTCSVMVYNFDQTAKKILE
jgi:predicted enzyme related to lactoylglutathione lyase